MSKLRIGKTFYSILIGEDGSCELEEWVIRSIKSGRVSYIQKNKWTWIKLSRKNFHWGWAKNIDGSWRRMGTVEKLPVGIYSTKIQAWREAIKWALLLTDDLESFNKAVSTCKRMIKRFSLLKRLGEFSKILD